MSQPALILRSKLPRPVDAAHPKYRRVQSIDTRVVAHILIRGSLGTAVWTVEIKRRLFTYPRSELRGRGNMTSSDLRDLFVAHQPAVYLVGRGKNDRRRRIVQTDSFQCVERT